MEMDPLSGDILATPLWPTKARGVGEGAGVYEVV